MANKICKHLDGDEIYCLMIKSKCVGEEYCSDYEEINREELPKEFDHAVVNPQIDLIMNKINKIIRYLKMKESL